MPGEPPNTFNSLACMLGGLTHFTCFPFHSHAFISKPAWGTPCMCGCEAKLRGPVGKIDHVRTTATVKTHLI